MKKEQFE